MWLNLNLTKSHTSSSNPLSQEPNMSVPLIRAIHTKFTRFTPVNQRRVYKTKAGTRLYLIRSGEAMRLFCIEDGKLIEAVLQRVITIWPFWKKVTVV
ncbi:hypothetical protein CL634_05335 [bacterium]|nr:hypothetical protein [bacterium]